MEEAGASGKEQELLYASLEAAEELQVMFLLQARTTNGIACSFFFFLKKSPWLEMVTLQNADADEVLQECTISGGVDGEG